MPDIPAATHPNCMCSIAAYYPDDNKNQLTHRNSYHLDGTDAISSYTLNKLLRTFIRRGGVVQMGKETYQHLRNANASASTFDSKHISISSWATKAAVQEELYHTR